DAALAIEQATNLRQHFPSLRIACLLQSGRSSDIRSRAREQKPELFAMPRSMHRLRAILSRFVSSLDSHAGTAAEGIDPCHSLIGNLNQFSPAEILHIRCLVQRAGRST